MRIFKLLIKIGPSIEENNFIGEGDDGLVNFTANKIFPILTQINVTEAEDIDEMVEEELESYAANYLKKEIILPLLVFLDAGQTFFVFNFIFLTKLVRRLLLTKMFSIYDFTAKIYFKLAIITSVLNLYNNMVITTKLEEGLQSLPGLMLSFKNWHKMFGRTINFRRKNAAKK